MYVYGVTILIFDYWTQYGLVINITLIISVGNKYSYDISNMGNV